MASRQLKGVCRNRRRQFHPDYDEDLCTAVQTGYGHTGIVLCSGTLERLFGRTVYMKKTEFYPLQLLLYNIINNINSVEVATQEGLLIPGTYGIFKGSDRYVFHNTDPVRYPWLQKYFIHV